jgi:hypothetical protein
VCLPPVLNALDHLVRLAFYVLPARAPEVVGTYLNSFSLSPEFGTVARGLYLLCKSISFHMQCVCSLLWQVLSET